MKPLKCYFIPLLFLFTFLWNFTQAQFSGTYYISDTSDYTTPGEAVDSLISQGVSGDVVFNILPGTYPDRFTIGAIPNAGSSAQVTFQSSTGDSSDVIITAEATETDSNFVIGFSDSVSYITFRDITLQATGDQFSRILWFTGDPFRITISNCLIQGTYRTGGANPDMVLIESHELALPDSLIFTNNHIEHGNTGFYMRSQVATPNDPLDGLIISNNKILHMGFRGIVADRPGNFLISGNEIQANVDAVVVNGSSLEGEILANHIFARHNGIAFATLDQEMIQPGIIANNFVHLGDSANFGLYLEGDNSFRVYYNTIYSTEDAAVNYGIGLASDVHQGVEIVNNVIAHKFNGSPLFFQDTAAVEQLDYNCYYTPGNAILASPEKVFDLSELRKYMGMDQHSLNVYPVFRGDSNLHALTPWFDGNGTPVAAITTDIDGQSRSGYAPDIGADEYTPFATHTNAYSGAYTVGSGGNFSSFEEAIDSLKVRGVDADVTLEFLSGSYEVNVTIPTFSGMGTESRLTITSQAQDSSDVTLSYTPQGETDNFILGLDGTDFTTVSHLTLSSEVNASYSSAIRLFGGCEDVRILNSALNGVESSSDNVNNALIIGENAFTPDLSVQQNRLNKFSHGLYLNLINNQSFADGISVAYNEFMGIGFSGITVSRGNGLSVKQNTLNGGSRGVQLLRCTDSIRVLGNQTNQENGYGIYLDSVVSSQQEEGRMANNFVTVAEDAQAHGIFIRNSDYQQVLYNSVNITSSTTQSSGAFYAENSDHLTVLNNIFHHSGTQYAYELSNVAIDSSDYNNFNTSGVNLASIDGTDYTSMTDLQSGSGTNTHSLSVVPGFTSTTDLHITTDSLDSRAIPLLSVITDIDGDDRDPLSPDIGADEFDPPPNHSPFVEHPIPDIEIPEDTGTFAVADLDTIFTDPDTTDLLSYSVSYDTANVSVSIENSVLSVLFDLNYNGPAEFVVEASDLADSTAIDTFNINVLPVNDTPYVVRSLEDLNLPEDTSRIAVASLDTIFGDVDQGDSLSYDVFSDTTGLVAEMNNDLLELEPAPDYHGTARVISIAQDRDSVAVRDTFQVTISPVNDPPYLMQPIPDQSLPEDTSRVTVAALDTIFGDVDSGDTLRYFVSSDTSAMVAELNDDLLEIEPGANFSGKGQITVWAVDPDSLTVQDIFKYHVIPVNDTPFIAHPIPDFEFSEDTSEVTLIALDTVVSDVDAGDTLNYSVTSDTTGVVAIIDGAEVIVETEEHYNGESQHIIYAQDIVGATVSDTFRLVVHPVNDTPIVQHPIRDLVIPEDTSQVTVALLDTVFTDVDTDDDLQYTVIGDTSAVALEINTGVLLLETAENFFGDSDIIVEARDNADAIVQDTFRLQVTPVNDTPYVSRPVADVTITEDTSQLLIASLDTIFTEVDPADTLRYASFSDTSGITSSIISEQLYLEPAPNYYGQGELIISAEDMGGLFVFDTVHITVTPVNDYPYVVHPIHDVTMPEDTSEVIVASLDTVFADIEDGVNLNYTLYSDTADLAVSISSGNIVLDPVMNFNGKGRVVVRAEDAQGASVQDTFKYSVSPTNDAPFLLHPIADRTIPEDTSVVTIALLDTVFSDVDQEDSLIYSAATDTSGIHVSLIADTLRLEPADNYFGTGHIFTTAEDQAGDMVKDTFSITVTPVNDTPSVISPIRDVNIPEDTSQIVVAALDTVFVDPDPSDILNYDVWSDTSALAVWFDGGLLWLEPAENFYGNGEVVAVAEDPQGLMVWDTVQYAVWPVNDTPYVAHPISDVEIPEDTSTVIVASLDTVFADADPEDLLTYSAISDTSGLVVEVNSGTITVEPQENYHGESTIMSMARDPDNAFVRDTFRVEVLSVNDAPYVAIPIPDIQMTEDAPLENIALLDTIFSDLDGDNLTYQTIYDTTEMEIELTEGLLALQPAPDFNGLSLVVAEATDTEGAAIRDTFNVSVSPVNDTPFVAQPISDLHIPEDTSMVTIADLDTVFRDVDQGDALAYTAESDTNAVTLEVASSQLFLYPEENFFGRVIVYVYAEDKGSLSAMDSLEVIISPVNDTPFVVQPLANLQLQEDFVPFIVASLDTIFSDVDRGDTLIYEAYSDTIDIEVQADTGLLRISASANYYGEGIVIISAEDVAGAMVMDTFNVTINSVNDPPVVVHPIPDLEMPEDTSLLQVASLDTVFTDVDAAIPLRYNVRTDTSGLEAALTDQLLTVEPEPDFYGTARVVAIATDENGAYAIDTIDVFVIPENDSPYVAHPIRDWVIPEDTTVVEIALLDTVFADSDPDDILSYSVSTDTSGMMAGIVSNTLLIQSEENYYGHAQILITAEDTTGVEAMDSFMVHVTFVNDHPYVASGVPDMNFVEDIGRVEVVDMDTVFADPDGLGSGEYSYESNASELNVIQDSTVLSIEPAPNFNGERRVILTFVDSFGLEARDTFSIFILPVNDRPQAEADFVTVSESTVIPVLDNDFDVDGDDLRILEVYGASMGSVGIESDNQTIRYTPFDFSEDNDNFKYIISDKNGGKDTATVFITLDIPEAYFAILDLDIDDLSHGTAMWGDYDLDGDFDLFQNGWTGVGAEYRSYVYNNMEFNLSETDIDLENLAPQKEQAAAWFDYKRNGTLGLLLTGRESGNSQDYKTVLYNYDGNEYISERDDFPDYTDGSVDYGDYDQDGDLDLLFTGVIEDLGKRTRIFRNDSVGTQGNIHFTALTATLGAISDGTGQWVDFDGDGDLDIFLSGSSYTQLYQNENGLFYELTHDIQGFSYVSADWGDYDQDGDPDLLISGRSGGQPITKIYRNEGSDKETNAWSFSDIGADITGVQQGSVAWGDIDGDGDLDVVVTGETSEGTGRTYVYLNFDYSFMQIYTQLPGLTESSLALGDYDNDQDLDIFLMGMGDHQPVSVLARNDFASSNHPPEAPENLIVSEITRTSARLAWDTTYDQETLSQGLTYNLRIGTSRTGHEVKSAMSLNTGQRLVPTPGNVRFSNSWVISGLTPDTKYYWSVQGIDNSFQGSTFASVRTFTTEGEEETGMDHIPLVRKVFVYPNPFENQCYVEFELMRPALVYVEIFDAFGKKLTDWKSEKIRGKHRQRFHLKKYGVFYFKIHIGNQVFVRKAVRVK